MDAHTSATILNEALSRLEAGEEPVKVLDTVFSAGYGYGLSQGHYDRDAEYYGVEGGGVIPPRDAVTPPHRHNRRGVDYTCHGCPDTTAERYSREAKARLAARIGENLAEEFTSAAVTTDRDVANTAELMAAAYEMGRQDTRQACEPADLPLTAAEPSQEVRATEAELPALCALQSRIPGKPWVYDTTWMEERYMSCTVAELLERYQRTASPGEEWRAVAARPEVVHIQAREPLSQSSGPRDHDSVWPVSSRHRGPARVGQLPRHVCERVLRREVTTPPRHSRGAVADLLERTVK